MLQAQLHTQLKKTRVVGEEALEDERLHVANGRCTTEGIVQRTVQSNETVERSANAHCFSSELVGC